MRWIIRTLLALAVLALLLVSALFLIPSDEVARLVSARISAATGQPVTIGAARATLWPEPGVRLTGVTIAGAGTATDEPPLLVAEALTVTVETAALWGGAVRLRDVTLTTPQITLIRRADGSVNWSAAAAEGAAAGDAAPTPGGAAAVPGPASGRLRDARITWADAATGAMWAADDVGLSFDLMADGTASVTADGNVAGRGLSATAELGDLAGALAGSVVPLTAQVDFRDGGSIAFDGRAGFAPMMAEGRIDADLPGPAPLAALAGLAAPDLPAGLGRDRIALGGTVTLTAVGSLHLRDATLALDDQILRGDADVVPGADRPRLTARLAAGSLTLPRPAPAPAGGAPAAAAPAPGWSDAPIDATALSTLDADIRLTADRLDAGAQILAPVDATLAIDRARAVLTIARAGAFGGDLTGTIVANNRDGLSVRADLAARGIDLAQLLPALTGQDRLTGTAAFDLSLLGLGPSPARIMQSLSGSAALTLAQGELKGIDLAAMLRTLDAGRVGAAERTAYDRATASFAIADGIARTSDIAIAAPLFSASGTGSIDLGARRLDLRLTPVALPGADGTGGYAVPLRILGPWSDLSYRLDVEDAAKARAEAELNEKLAEELGLEPTTGESFEDAAKRKLEEELLRGLGGLLRGN